VNGMKFVISKSANGQYWFKIVASNGQTLAHSEQYTSKQSAQEASDSIKRDAGGADTDDES
jgi:uncharacterized protein YegP (UPF0339 family)